MKMNKILQNLITAVLFSTIFCGCNSSVSTSAISNCNVGGYMIVHKEKVDNSYNAGYSLYSAAWPLEEDYHGRSFQTGLFGTWLFPDSKGPIPGEKFYTDIEGGLGWHRDTEFATPTPKFIMGGVQLNFSAWANGPGAGKGRDWSKPKGKYGVAQLSPWLLFPPDGLNLKQGTCGQWFGRAYLPLPLTEPKSTTAGKNVPTGNQCWTLFLNTGNFKGPVAFFTPYFWSEPSVKDPRLAGLFLDQRPTKANKQYQMETQYIHSAEATDSKGQRYFRMAKTLYPVNSNDNSELLQRAMVYNKKALWDDVEKWFKGGKPVDGKFNVDEGGCMQKIKKGLSSSWKFYDKDTPKDKRAPLNIMSFIDVNVTDSSTLRVKLHGELLKKETINGHSVVVLPEYYKLVKKNENDVGEWVAVAAKDVPKETGLSKVKFDRKDDERERVSSTYVTPSDANSSWKNPGPVAGPFKVKIGDGSTLTYYWYRFADQPALLNADMTSAEREEMQRRVELIQKNWTKDKEYLPAPLTGELADIDPALIVTPPAGLEIGYVPIVTQQGIE